MIHRKIAYTPRIVLMSLMVVLIPTIALAIWTSIGSVTDIYSTDGYHFIKSSIAEDACGTAGKFYWPTSDADSKDMFALALTAYTASKRISVSGDFVAPTCLNGGTLITLMRITD